MTELISQAGAVLKQGTELMKIPAVSGAVAGLFGWLKKAFKNNKRAQERLELIQKAEANEETIKQLQTNLDDLLYDNEEYQKQLAEMVEEVKKQADKAGVKNVTKTNTMNVTGNSNISIQDSKGDINLNQ
ncbi:MAG: hypothetical protein U9N85_09035 [Bacteroidota bacterium]|nr:hypothetical protein [Bacteroidota bacterium]